MKKEILVVYHRADFDGICSYQVAKRVLGLSADYQGWDYGEPAPDMDGYKTVYAIDICFDVPVMEKYADRLIWIDHHKSAIEKCAHINLKGYRIDGVAACRLAYQWFLKEWRDSMGMIWLLPDKFAFVNRAVEEPYAVQLLGEFDIWDKRNPDTDAFQLGLYSIENPNWNKLFDNELTVAATRGQDNYVAKIISDGHVVERYMEIFNAQIAQERGFDIEFEGLMFRALNIARCNSMTFKHALRPHHDACLAYFWNGKAWRFSLYHATGKEHHDLSKIAVKYGGGGHRGACGFEMKNLPVNFGGKS